MQCFENFWGGANAPNPLPLVARLDGTFRIAPNLFSQVLVLLAEEHGGVHPVIYGLLPNKTAMSYQLFFDMLKGLRANLNPD